MSSVAGGIDAMEAVFDDGSLVADAGLLLAGTVMDRLGLEALIDDTVRLGGSAGAGAGRKVLTVAASMLVGGRCIQTPTGCGRARRVRCCPLRWWRRRLRGRFCGRSRSGMCASSTRRPSWGLCGRGLWARRPTSRR